MQWVVIYKMNTSLHVTSQEISLRIARFENSEYTLYHLALDASISNSYVEV